MRFVVLAAACAVVYAQPLWFEPNQGQAHPSVQFLAHTPGGYVYFARDKMTLRDVRMDLLGTNKQATVELEEPTGGISSYFIGRSEKDWHTGIPHYGRARYKNVYAGIDLVYYATGRDIEYDFVLKPGADPRQIKLAYSKPVQIDSNGDLLIAGLKQHRPKVLQNGHEIACNYLIRDRSQIQLALATYNHSQPLTVDPVLEFSTYLGGPGSDEIERVAIDSGGFIYLAGNTQSPAAPGLNPFQQAAVANTAPFIFKLTPSGDRVLYYVILGSNGFDEGRSIAVDRSGSPVMVGVTRTTSFPLKNPFQAEFRAAYGNGFITKITSDAKSLIYSSYLGGSNSEYAFSVALDPDGNAYVAGITASHDFPVLNASQPTFGGGHWDGFLSKVSPTGKLAFSTYYGGSGDDFFEAMSIAPDGLLITGGSASVDLLLVNATQKQLTSRSGYQTPILGKFTFDGACSLMTFFGGGASGIGAGVAADPGGNIYVAGSVWDSSFTTKNAFQNSMHGPTSGFLVKFDATGRSLLYGTFLGGSGYGEVQGISVDSIGSAYVSGVTASTDFPVKDSLQPFRGGGPLNLDCFLTKFAPSGDSLRYSTFFGGSGHEYDCHVATDQNGAAYLSGWTRSLDFPVLNAYQPTSGGGNDGFLAKISDLAASPLTVSPDRLVFQYMQGGAIPTPQTVVVAGPAFSLSTSVAWLSALASGTTVSVAINPAGLATGTYIGTIALITPAGASASIGVTLTVSVPGPQFIAGGVVNAASFAAGPVASGEIITIFGTNLTDKVTFDNIPATLVFASPTQINVTVPFALTAPSTMIQVGSSAPVKLDVAPSAPGIFTAVSGGDNVIVLYATGCGALTTDDLPRCALPVAVTVNDQPATVLYAGVAPGLVQGANQINIQLPDGAVSSPLTIVLTAGDASSKPFVWNQP